MTGVNRVHATSSTFQKDFGESPRSGSDVEARLALNYDTEGVEGSTQFLCATKFLLADDDDRSTAFDAGVGVGDNAPVNTNAARVYRGPRIAQLGSNAEEFVYQANPTRHS